MLYDRTDAYCLYHHRTKCSLLYRYRTALLIRVNINVLIISFMRARHIG
jgi:hypothetical protein